MLSLFRSCWKEHRLQTRSLFAGLAVETWQCAREEGATCSSISTRAFFCYLPHKPAAQPHPALFGCCFVKHWQNDAWQQFFYFVWLQIRRPVCPKAFFKFHWTHAIEILCIVYTVYCVTLYSLGRKQQKRNFALNKKSLWRAITHLNQDLWKRGSICH